MRIYFKFIEHAFVYPDDMERILSHLTLNGTLFVGGPTVEQLYGRFSEEQYAAGWMSVTPEILEEFASWLTKIEI